MDMTKLEQFLGSFTADLAATGAAGSTAVGNRLGLYRALADGAATPAELAVRTGCNERYLAEWLRGQTAGGYVSYDPDTARFHLDEEQAFCLADPQGPDLSSAFLAVLGYLQAEPLITEAFRTGDGVGWHEHHPDVFVGVDAFYRAGYAASLVPAWIPALDGVHDRLTAGARVADVACGLGSTSMMIAQAYPNSTVTGSDYHVESIEIAQKRVAEAGLGDRVSFEVATAQSFSGSGFDLVLTADALHDLGDPVGAARRVRESLAPDGTWLVVEPVAPEAPVAGRDDVARLYYAGSLFLCLPNSLAQDGGYALGAQAGEDAIRQIAGQAGFTRFRRASETPFNAVYEIRP